MKKLPEFVITDCGISAPGFVPYLGPRWRLYLNIGRTTGTQATLLSIRVHDVRSIYSKYLCKRIQVVENLTSKQNRAFLGAGGGANTQTVAAWTIGPGASPIVIIPVAHYNGNPQLRAHFIPRWKPITNHRTWDGME
jgi:hypothetical protein